MPIRAHHSRSLVPRVLALAAAGLLALTAALGAEPEPDGDSPRPIPAFRQAEHVAILTVRDEIDRVTLLSLERRAKQAIADGAEAIVLDIDTPGGEVTATLDICNLLKDPGATPRNTVAWIHPQAYSAGTIIALACREIVVAPNATFGDAAPINVGMGGLRQLAPAERAKIEAPILAEVIDSARRNHYDENLVQAFVSVGVELWLLENVHDGRHVCVTRDEYVRLFGEEPPDQITSTTPPVTADADPVQPWVNTVIPTPEPSDDPVMTAEEIREQIEYQQSLPSVRPSLDASERDDWRLVMQVVSNDRLLTVKRNEALFYGLAQATVSSDDQIKRFLGAKTVTRYDRSWSESLVRFLVNPIVRIVLIVIFLVCLFVEMAAPGLGVFGAASLGALVLLVGAPALAGLAQWWEIILIVGGLGLIAAEIFVVPGTGITGVAGVLCLFVGLVATFVGGGPSFGTGGEDLGTAVISTLTGLFAAAVGIWIVSRQLGSLPFFDRVVLKAEIASPTGGTAAPALDAGHAIEVGAVGVAATDLRPAGQGRFEHGIVDVQSTGRYIERDAPIRVTSVDRTVIEVEDANA